MQKIGHERVGGVNVEVLSGLVDHEHREVGEERAGKRESLALTAGDLGPVGADAGPAQEVVDELPRLRRYAVALVGDLVPAETADDRVSTLLNATAEQLRGRNWHIQFNTNLAVVAPGIAEALLTTAIGLAAAIPAVMMYNYFARKVGAYNGRMNNFVGEFSTVLSRHLDRKA